MKNASWTFAKGDLASIADMDAALAAAAGGSDEGTANYVVRVNHRIFAALVQPVIVDLTEGSDGADVNGLNDIAIRLKGSRLAILPTVPPLHELVADPKLTNVLLARPLLLSLGSGDQATLRAIEDEDLRGVRKSELVDIVLAHRQRALLSVDEGHFELPSGAHTSHFFRLAECLANADDLDRIVYWIARDISFRQAVASEGCQLLLLVDNPSTLIIALRLAQVFPTTAIQYDCVRAYPEHPHGTSDLQQWLQSRLNSGVDIHCIVSVSSTGGFTNALSIAAANLGINVSFSVLYATTQEVAGESYCSLKIPDYWHSDSAEHCTSCQAQNSAVFRIDKARYFLTERNVTSVALPAVFFKSQKDFIEKYGAFEGVLNSHVNDLSWKNGKHRAFGVDVGRLIQIDAFRDEISIKIRGISPVPDLVVVPPHPGAIAIAEFLRESLKLNVVVHSNLRLDPTIAEDRALAALINKATSLLIVDDVAYTFERIQSYVKAIRESGEIYQAPPNVTLLPLLALSSNDEELAAAIRGIEADHDGKTLSVCSLYRFPLPDWDEKSCPWCFESRLIRQMPSAFGEDETDETDLRGVALSNVEKGLHQRSWMSIHGQLVAPLFGKNSPLLQEGASSIQVLFACASAIQQARTANGKNRLDPERFPKSTALGVQVIRDFQNETLVVICLLRCLLSTEVGQEARTYLREMIARIGAPDGVAPDLWALRELLLAQMRGLASQIDDEAVRRSTYDMAGFGAYL